MNDVVIYNEDNSYTEYAGQAVVFTLTMADGTQTESMAYNPFLVIDDVGYKTKYASSIGFFSYFSDFLKDIYSPKTSRKASSSSSFFSGLMTQNRI